MLTCWCQGVALRCPMSRVCGCPFRRTGSTLLLSMAVRSIEFLLTLRGAKSDVQCSTGSSHEVNTTPEDERHSCCPMSDIVVNDLRICFMDEGHIVSTWTLLDAVGMVDPAVVVVVLAGLLLRAALCPDVMWYRDVAVNDM